LDGDGNFCPCGDFGRNSKNDPTFRCKHLLAIINCVPNEIKRAEFLEKVKPKLDERFVISIEGQDFVKYAGLLDLAHQKKLCRLEVEILQYPTNENGMMAICKARAETATGECFTDIGDASPANCHARIAKHCLRLASTRAKSRAIRDCVNVGMTALEELGDLDEVIGNEQQGTAQKGRVRPFPRKIAKADAQPNNGDGNSPEVKATDTLQNVSRAEVKEMKEPTQEPQKDETKTNQPEAKGLKKSASNGKVKADTPSPKMSEAQHRALMNLSRRRKIPVDQLQKMSQETYGVPVESLNAAAASQFIRTLQQST
jgi:hypothetical protein